MLKINKKGTNKINLLEIFIIMSPLIDLITSLSIRFLNFTFTFGMIIRFLFLLFLLCYLFFYSKSKYKKSSIILLVILLFFSVCNLLNMYFLKGFINLFLEVKILLKTFYFPISLIVLFNYFSERKRELKIRTFNTVSIIYLMLIFVPALLDFSFSAYSGNKIGYIGLFYAANEISAILAILAPFIIAFVMQNYKKWYTYVLLYFYTYMMLLIGTKVSFLGILLSILVFLFVYTTRYILKMERRSKLWEFIKIPIIIPIIICTLIVVSIYKSSALSFNMAEHRNALVKQYEEKGKHQKEVIGLTKEDYINLIFSNRDNFNNIMKSKFSLVNTKEQLFGLGYYDHNNLFDRQYNIIEIDYGDVFYLYGIIGFILYFSLLLLILVDLIIISFKRFKRIINDDQTIPYYSSIALTLGIAFFAGHVFTAPAVSIYPAIIIPALYFKIKPQKGKNLIDNTNIFLQKHGYWLLLFLCLVLSILFNLTF